MAWLRRPGPNDTITSPCRTIPSPSALRVGAMAEDLTFPSVRVGPGAIAHYLASQTAPPCVGAGYDTRFRSEKFAEVAFAP